MILILNPNRYNPQHYFRDRSVEVELSLVPPNITIFTSSGTVAPRGLSFPEAKRPRLSEWAEGYAGLRAAAGAASRFAAPDLRSKEGLVGGLRRLSARLLKPPMEEPEEAAMGSMGREEGREKMVEGG